MPIDIFEERRKGLEKEFFTKKNETLRQKLKAVFEHKATLESLRAASGVTNEAVLETMLALNVTQATMAAFALFPLVEVGWADGKLDQREREALMAAARATGIAPGSPADTLLDHWFQQPPGPEGRKAWHAYASELNRKLNPAERAWVRDELQRRARAVAEASGGFLGIGRISSKEEAVLEAIGAAFPD